VPDDAASEPLLQAFEDVPTLLELVRTVGLAQQGDTESATVARSRRSAAGRTISSAPAA
jgi:hypothetical protein